MLDEGQVHQGDCVALLTRAAESGGPIAELIFADPPFNIGYSYDEYDDRVEYDRYVAWTESWMRACLGILKPHGSFYVAIGDEYAAEVRMIARKLGLHLRNWIVWHYTFGQNTKQKFSRSHAHIFYLVNDPKRFVFNDRQVRVPSARHTEYSDKRADPWGRIPDDTWTEFPRVCGTFNERQGWHGCQMPESLLMRIVRASSDAGDLVLDPFAGSGTTLVAAAKLGRRFIGIEISKEYVAQARKRLEETSKETSKSQKVKKSKHRSLLPARRDQGQSAIRPGAPGQSAIDDGRWPPLHLETLCSLFRETNTRIDRLVPNAVAMECFTRLLNARLSARYTAGEVGRVLELLDRSARLPRLRNDRPFNPRPHKDRRPCLWQAPSQAELF